MRRTSTIFVNLVLSVFLIVAIGCDSDNSGQGMLTVEIWGEDFIEEGIPASEFVDGYGITFTKFLVNVSDIGVAVAGEDAALEVEEKKIWDLTGAGPFEIATGEVPSGNYTDTRYSILKADGSSLAGNASPADTQLMIDAGYSVYVEGTATDGTVQKSFTWGFENETVFGPCHSIGNLEKDGNTTVQLTIHGDHLFYDSAVSSDPSLRFADIALADADGDDEVTMDELANYSIDALANYGVGSMEIHNMWDYIVHMATTLGHIDGEGHCEMQ